MSIIIFSSLLSVRLFSRGEMNRARERGGRREKERKGKKKKKKEEEAKRSFQGGTIFGANGYKRGDWPRPIHHRVPPRLFSPSALHFSCSPSLRLSLLSSLEREGSWRKEEGSRGSK